MGAQAEAFPRGLVDLFSFTLDNETLLVALPTLAIFRATLLLFFSYHLAKAGLCFVVCWHRMPPIVALLWLDFLMCRHMGGAAGAAYPLGQRYVILATIYMYICSPYVSLSFSFSFPRNAHHHSHHRNQTPCLGYHHTVKFLPLSIPQGTKGDKIWNVMKGDECDTAHETFNMRFDVMFGEDCRDSSGRLHHISRGKFELGCVCLYLAKIDWSDDFPLDLVEIKLQRLITELRYIWCVAGLNCLVISWLIYL
jgi:hypothetical protein